MANGMFMKKWGTILVGAIGFFGGTYFERSRIFDNVELPSIRSVFAHEEPRIPFGVEAKVNRTADIMRFGFPGLDNIRSRKDFVLSYDRRNRVAHWVCEHLTKQSVEYNDAVNRAKSEFYEDDSIHLYFRSRNTDFRGSGYDRGHLAAAGNHRSSQELIDETFVLSNMAPQVGKGFNRDYWNKLERYVRSLTKKYRNIYVCTGPLYLPRYEADGKKYVKFEVIGNNNVAVPTHFFKVVVGETERYELDLETYLLPNAAIDDNLPLRTFLVPLSHVEKASGLLLFDKIPQGSFRSINGMKV